MLPEKFEKLAYLAYLEKASQDQWKYCIRVCTAAGCLTAKSGQVKQALETEVEERGLSRVCQVKGVGCMGLCSAGPLVSVEPDSVLYREVKADDAEEIIHSLGEHPVRRLECPTNIPFFRRQTKIVLENAGSIDPYQIEDYIVAGGYQGLDKVISHMLPHEVVQEIKRSKLRGRGGAGYPTGLKWSSVAQADGAQKFVICNADEGDPGAFMDRTVLESDPHRVLEGMAIAAYAVGANHGYIYVRAEYPLVIERLRIALAQAEEYGFLGSHILETDFSFTIALRIGAGAYVCGEETALIASIEGGRGMPYARPPYPSDQGLWGYPTLINNVETFANVPPIISRGSQWFTQIGTPQSTGTKVFSLAGHVAHTGVIEVPMGITLRDIVCDIGGDVPHHRRFKAVQTGGPTGGCIPEQHLDTPVDYESLLTLGSMMGAGGLIVIDDSCCMVDLTRYFMDFCMSESCGKCVPCRVGTAQMVDLLDGITHGTATLDDLDLLERLAAMVKRTSLCGLGQGAPTPLLSTLRYFREEYLNHITQHHCQAGVCSVGTTEVIS